MTTALQPFRLARAVVHAVADPIVFNAPRLVTTLVTAPVRAARLSETRVYRGIAVEEDEPPVRAVQVAYFSSNMRPSYPPPAPAGEADEDDEVERPRLARAVEENEVESAAPSVRGGRAVLRGGVAIPPAGAPANVRSAIQAVNSLRHKPYVWGGGHGSFYDRGYDCSGTVSFALRGAGALSAPLPSSDLMRYGERGRGRWITIYARPGHTFAVIAGLRLDTTDFRRGGNTGPRWHEEARDTRGYVARHPAGL